MKTAEALCGRVVYPSKKVLRAEGLVTLGFNNARKLVTHQTSSRRRLPTASNRTLGLELLFLYNDIRLSAAPNGVTEVFLHLCPRVAASCGTPRSPSTSACHCFMCTQRQRGTQVPYRKFSQAGSKITGPSGNLDRSNVSINSGMPISRGLSTIPHQKPSKPSIRLADTPVSL
jgi:hypothetical protein